MIRKIKLADVQPLKEILERIPLFTVDEVDVAMELINIAAYNENQTDYYIYVYEEDGKVLGYHCTGRRPLTDAVYDLYWIAADPEAGKKGIGKKLLEHCEEFVKENNGRWLLAETSSRDVYNGTRDFYVRNNFTVVAEIKDFYSLNDDLVIFGKNFGKTN